MNIQPHALALCIVASMTMGAQAVSVGTIVSKCGDDSKHYCMGKGYGDAMLECLNGQYKNLAPKCKPIMDRLNEGEGVSLF